MEHVATRLDAEDFKKLVSGEAVSLTGYTNGREVAVKLILADIGWGEMLHIVRAAMARIAYEPELIDDPEVRAMAHQIKKSELIAAPERAMAYRLKKSAEPAEDEPCILPPGDPLKVS